MNFSEIEKGILHLSENDRRVANIIQKVGQCRLKAHNDYFKSLLEAIIGQQLSMKAAESIFNRFTGHFYGIPSPELVLATDDLILRSLGLSNAKVRYVKDLSAKVISKELSLRAFGRKTDEEIIASLTQVKGIGTWTAHMFLIFTLCRLNVLPTGDLGIKKAILLNYKLKTLPDEKMVEKISMKNNWHPFNSLASWYLWKSLEL